MRTIRISKLAFLLFLMPISLNTACGDSSGGNDEAVMLPDDPVAPENGDGDMVDPAADGENPADGEDSPDETPMGGTDAVDDEMEPTPEPPMGRGPAELFGEALSEGIRFVPFEELIENPDKYDDKVIQTEGGVRQVCQRRGCWMEVRSLDDPSGENITVRFLDYGFFVPLDSRGAIVRIQGTPAVDTLTAEEVEELLAEGYDPGIVQEDGTATVIRFTASGVMMWNRLDD